MSSILARVDLGDVIELTVTVRASATGLPPASESVDVTAYRDGDPAPTTVPVVAGDPGVFVASFKPLVAGHWLFKVEATGDVEGVEWGTVTVRPALV